MRNEDLAPTKRVPLTREGLSYPNTLLGIYRNPIEGEPRLADDCKSPGELVAQQNWK